MKRGLVASSLVLGLLGGSALAVSTQLKRAETIESIDQLMFFAVLEGLYRDGVRNDDVDIILTRAKSERGEQHIYFVYGCPLCTPTLDAFRTYRQRAPFSTKAIDSTFGPGLRPASRKALRSDDHAVVLAEIQRNLDRWVRARLDGKRLEPTERRHYERNLQAYRDKGMAILKARQESGESMFVGKERCAICDGAASDGH